MKIIELNIKGMTYPGCGASVSHMSDELEGIETKTINHVTDTGKIVFDEKFISEKEIIKKINENDCKNY